MDAEKGFIDACKSLFLAICSVHAVQKIAGWLAETAGACASAVIVAVVVWFVMRWVEKKFPRKNRNNPYGDRL